MNIASEAIALLKNAADASSSQKMSDYMRNQFDFFGITSPIRKSVLKTQYAHSLKLPIDELIMVIHELWQQNERECQYAALDMLIKNKRRLRTEDLGDVEYWLTHKQWWDTIDALASHIVGILFEKNDSIRVHYVQRWLTSSDIWLNRTCLIYQLKYKNKTNFQLLTQYIDQLKHKDEFFIQKAIGWSLRQHSRIDAEAVMNFVQKTELSNLARKEALRLII